MNQVELQSSLSKRSIGASALSFFKSGQWAKQADEQRWQPCQYLCKVLDPSGLDQDMIHDDVVADLGEFGDRSMEAADEPIAYDSSAICFAHDVVPEWRREIAGWEHPEELVETCVQVRISEFGLQRTKEGGFARTGRSVENDDGSWFHGR